MEWVEATLAVSAKQRAPALYPSLEANAQNRLDADQTGWIAACFLE
jgi:hypothetical protein